MHMTLKECYLNMGADYDDTFRRLCTDSLISRFLLKFADDANYEKLVAAVAAKDAEASFAAAHTLKGIILNLGLSQLFTPVNEITECVRHGWDDRATELITDVQEAYAATIQHIRDWETSNS